MSDHLRRDFTGRMLCDHCWCGMHELNKIDPVTGKTKMKIPNCLGHGCECLCIQVQAQKRARRAHVNYTVPNSDD